MKIRCRFHDDRVASMHLYEDHAFCYVCGKYASLDELGMEGAPVDIKPRYVEDIEAKAVYIWQLPRKLIRGFSLPYDDDGYYIEYPNSLFYKFRFWNPPEGKDKYRCPSGHPKEPFVLRMGRSPSLLIVEGEMNAMSLGEACPEYDVVSPGAASDFLSKKTGAYLTTLCHYANMLIIVDRDAAGTVAAIHTKARLSTVCRNVSIVLMPRDANEILVNDGPQALKEEFKRAVSRAL
jgi:hypothetical protein